MNENCALLESDTASNAASPLELESEKVRGTSSSFEFIFVCLKIVIILTRFFLHL